MPPTSEIRALVESEFYTPFASPAAHAQLFKGALRLVQTYATDYAEDLTRIWELERQFELHTPDGLLTGRADVILENEEGRKQSLAIVDYKVSKSDQRADRNELQLRIYSHAGRREGFDIRGAYLHNLGESRRTAVNIDEGQVAESVKKAENALSAIRAGHYPPATSRQACSSRDHARICRYCEKSVRSTLDE